jgi:hypothetical protein
MPELFPPPLSAEVSQPLLSVADAIARIAPWKFMSDLELMGLRDEKTGELFIATILGTLGTMFAVVIYRNDEGLRLMHQMATERGAPDSEECMELTDCLKVEWCPRKELHKSDLKTLEAAGFKPKGRGPIWPRFESCRPGWFPWGMTDAEATQMTLLLRKVLRFVHLREAVGLIHEEPIAARLPMIPAGDELTLKRDEVEWLPFVAPPAPIPEPVTFSATDQASLASLPVQPGFIAEVMAPLAPEVSFVDEAAGRPCIARMTFTVDRDSGMLLGAEMSHGAKPLHEAVGTGFAKALRKAKVRPVRVQVSTELLAWLLRPACESIGVPLRVGPLKSAPRAWEEFASFISLQQLT